MTLALIKGYSQTLTLGTLIKYLNKDTDQIAEELLQKGYSFYGNQNYPSFQKGNGNDNFSIDLNRNGENYLQTCSSIKFNYIFTSLDKEIKTTSRKLKFFYSEWAKGYVTEYLYKNKYYIYTGQGICFTKDNKPMKYIYLSDQNLKSIVFSYK